MQLTSRQQLLELGLLAELAWATAWAQMRAASANPDSLQKVFAPRIGQRYQPPIGQISGFKLLAGGTD
jgi:hypothetical protein